MTFVRIPAILTLNFIDKFMSFVTDVFHAFFKERGSNIF